MIPKSWSAQYTVWSGAATRTERGGLGIPGATAATTGATVTALATTGFAVAAALGCDGAGLPPGAACAAGAALPCCGVSAPLAGAAAVAEAAPAAACICSEVGADFDASRGRVDAVAASDCGADPTACGALAIV